MTDCGHFTFAPDDPVRRQLGLGAAALRYQAMGYAVLPLARGAKKPHRLLPLDNGGLGGGVHWATLDERMPWWAWGQDPAAGIGVACGAVSRLLVVDLDVKGTADGREQFWAWVSRYGLQATLPPRPTVSTPSGGQHLWFRTPQSMEVGQRLAILPGVDIKGDGGYVVAPPSMIKVDFGEHGGDRGVGSALVDYRWASGCPCTVPDAPEWLFKWIEQTPALGGEGSGVIAGQAAELTELQQTGLPRGQRNNQLYLTACSLYGRYGTDNTGQAAVWAQIQPVLQATERAGFSDHEVGVVLASARRFIERKRAEEGSAVSSMDAWKKANGMPG